VMSIVGHRIVAIATCTEARKKFSVSKENWKLKVHCQQVPGLQLIAFRGWYMQA
jgi:predicted nucleotidyltransferase